MIKGAKILEKKGAKVIVTSCGFNAIFQKELADTVSVPVISSSLVQVPMISTMLKEDQTIAIITANKKCLTNKHIRNAGITDDIKYVIGGLDQSTEFQKIHNYPNSELNKSKFTEELLSVVEDLINTNSNIGAIVFECTDLPPFAPTVRKKFNLPVFDIVTLVNMLHSSSIC